MLKSADDPEGLGDDPEENYQNEHEHEVARALQSMPRAADFPREIAYHVNIVQTRTPPGQHNNQHAIVLGTVTNLPKKVRRRTFVMTQWIAFT